MVRCNDCGFLCVFFRDSKELAEVPDHWRETGIPDPRSDQAPRCFVGAFRLPDEMGDALSRTDPKRSAERYLEVINKERNCPKHYPYVQGYSPKEHLTMQREDILLKMQAESRERDRAWQEEQRRGERQWQEEQKRQERRWQEQQKRQDHRFQVRWGLISIVVAALLGAFLTYLGGFLKDRSTPDTAHRPPAATHSTTK